jgi:transposase
MSYTTDRRWMMRPVGSPSELQRRRERAITLLEEGFQPVDIASMLGVDRRSVRRWKAAFRQSGKSGLQAIPAPGRPPKLTKAERVKLEKVLFKGAKAAGFPTELWTCPRVAAAIKSHFDVRYHVDHIGRLLRSLGWSPQKPTRRAVERDEDVIQLWVKKEWPRVKKRLRD